MDTGKRVDFLLEWGSTVVLMIGVWLTAINYYPLNIFFSVAGNFGWFIVALRWKKLSLMVVQLIVVSLYVVGVLTS